MKHYRIHLQKDLETKQIRIKKIEGTNQREEVKKIHPTLLSTEVLIKN